MKKQLVWNRLLVGLLVICSMHWAAAEELGDNRELPPEKYLSEGMKELSISGGFGSKLPFDRFDDRTETQYVAIVPSVGYFVSDRQELLLEAPILYFQEPETAFTAGLDLMYRYHFTRNRKFSPFVELGAGVNYVGLDVRELTDKFQFSVQGGVGVRSKVSDHGDVVVSLRWHHFSNAGTRYPNIGLNDSLLMIGYSQYF